MAAIGATGRIPAGLDPTRRPPPPPAGTFPARVVVQRARIGMRAALGGVFGFAAIFAIVRARRSDALDLAMTMKLQRLGVPGLETLMRAASWPGFAPQSRLIPPLATVGLFVARLRLEAAFVPLAWGTALIASVTKAMMKRPRPVAGADLRVVAARLGGSSFPSGHVITYVGVYGFLAYLANALIKPAAVRRVVVGGLIGLVGLVGPSRVREGHHWFTDVAASYLLGSSYLVVLSAAYRQIKARHARVEP
jgi:membrane-associated phospholipid phosphatase